MKKTSITMDNELHRKVRVYCAKNDCQIRDLFKEAVEEKMERNNHE